MRLISYCITKNEAGALTNTLNSVKDISDLIVVVDTGSTDGTLEEARKFTDHILIHPKSEQWREHPEEFDFSDARNFALEYIESLPDQPDWILSMDCDEILTPESRASLKRKLESVPDIVDLVLLTIEMQRDDGTAYQRFLAERLLRGGRKVRFQGAMHNWVDVPLGERRAAIPDIELHHCRSVRAEQTRSDRVVQRIAMAERHFKDAIASDPNDRRSLFYLAGTYFDAGRIDEAIEWFEKYLPVSDWPEEKYQARILLAQAYLDKQDTDRATVILSEALTDNWKRAEAYLMLGRIANQKGDNAQAEWWFKAASIKELPIDPLFVEVAAHTWEPHFELFKVYRDRMDVQLAADHGKQAVELGAPVGELSKWFKNHTQYGSQKICALVDRGQLDFIQPVIDEWARQGKDVTICSRACDVPADSEIVWCEWAALECAAYTKREKTARIIVRVHGYETHSGYIEQVNWSNVDDVIFVADYLHDMAVSRCPAISEYCNAYIVPGGVDTGKFTIADGKTGTKIAMACFGNSKKNFPMALQIMAKLPEKYTLHIATEWQEDRDEMYFRHMREVLGLEGRVTLHQWQTDLNEFYADKDFYLSCSTEESFHYALAEGMAAGLKPLIHAWKSAHDFYDEKWIFGTVDEAVDMVLAGVSPIEYADYAKAELDVSRNLIRINRVIARPRVGVLGSSNHPHSSESKILQCMEQLGCCVDSHEADLLVIQGHDVRKPPGYGGKTILWQAELVDGDSDKAVRSRELIAPTVPEVDIVVAHQQSWVQPFVDMGAKRVECVPWVGAWPPFRPLGIEKDIDVGFYGAATERRKQRLTEIGEALGLNIMWFQSPDHEAINTFVNKCKIVINVHAYEKKIVEVRLSECMAAGACVVSELLPEGHPYTGGGFVQTDDIVGEVQRLLGRPAEREEIAKRGHRWIWTKLNMKRQVEKVLELAGL